MQLLQRMLLTAGSLLALCGSISRGVNAQPPPARIEAEVLTITEKYVHPAQITRPVGPFLLVIKNHSSLKHLVVHIKARGGSDVKQASLDEVGGNWDALLDLPAGVYELTEPGNPALRVTLTLLAK